MPQQNKRKRRAKKQSGHDHRRDLIFAEPGQVYAKVTDMLGGGRVRLTCVDGRDRLGVIRGTMRRKVWLHVGDIVLVGTRDFQDDKADVIHKYLQDEARALSNYKELPPNFMCAGVVGEALQDQDQEEDVIFDDI